MAARMTHRRAAAEFIAQAIDDAHYKSESVYGMSDADARKISDEINKLARPIFERMDRILAGLDWGDVAARFGREFGAHGDDGGDEDD